MRERNALRKARRFVSTHYPMLASCHVEVCLEEDGNRLRSWSFGVHRNYEDEGVSSDNSYVGTGYVHADGRVDGLY